MQPLLRPREPLAVKHGVDVARENIGHAIALFPGGAKPVGVVAAAEEARPVPRGERGCLVEKEQLGPAVTTHHLAPPSLEFADASEPRLAGPAPRQQRLGCGVMNDAAIAGEHSAMRCRDDVACRSDPVLQRHSHLELAVLQQPSLRVRYRPTLLDETANRRVRPLLCGVNKITAVW